MTGKLSIKSRMVASLLMVMLLTGCLGIGSQLTDRKAVEAEVARFQANVTSENADGYHDLTQQFTNPYVWQLNEDQLASLHESTDSLIEEKIIPILQDPDDPEFESFFEYAPAYIVEKMNDLIALYEAKKTLVDPEVIAGINQLAETIMLYPVLVGLDIMIQYIEAEEGEEIDIEDPDEYDDSRVIAWLADSAILDNGVQLPNATVIFFMALDPDSDFTWGDEVVLEHVGKQWIAEIPISYTDEETYDIYEHGIVLTFSQQGSKWKISKIQLLDDDVEDLSILGI